MTADRQARPELPSSNNNELPERIVELDRGVAPEAAISGIVLVCTERSTFLTFNAMRPTSEMSPSGLPYRESAGTAILEFHYCSITKLGYPNDDAWSGIPRTKGLSYGIYEVLDSDWSKELQRLNRYSFPDTTYPQQRHFLILGHDSSFECLAEDFTLEVVDQRYEEVFARITKRVLAE